MFKGLNHQRTFIIIIIVIQLERWCPYWMSFSLLITIVACLVWSWKQFHRGIWAGGTEIHSRSLKCDEWITSRRKSVRHGADWDCEASRLKRFLKPPCFGSVQTRPCQVSQKAEKLHKAIRFEYFLEKCHFQGTRSLSKVWIDFRRNKIK